MQSKGLQLDPGACYSKQVLRTVLLVEHFCQTMWKSKYCYEDLDVTSSTYRLHSAVLSAQRELSCKT